MTSNTPHAQSENVHLLFDELASALSRAENRESQNNQYLDRLIEEIKSTRLTRNPPAADTAAPTMSWRQIFTGTGEWHSNLLLRAIHDLGPLRVWTRADDFYPEPEHRHFSENVWGALIAGQDDAMFSSDERFIALLIVMDADTVYPLHAHRIEELYYVLSGHADWSHDGKQWDTLPPGSIFHNASYQPHTMRTRDHPLLTMGLYLPPFGWEGRLLDTNPPVS